jgi:Flp pilus assembly protein TadD
MMVAPARARAFAIAAGVFVAVVTAALVVRTVEPLGVDQGLFACFARWIPRGWLPYRDLFDSKPPLFLYTYALASIVPGDVVSAIGCVDGAFLVASVASAFIVGSRVWTRWTGLACAALLFIGLWSPAWGGFWSRAQAEELLALPMIGAAWLAWRSVQRHPLATWAGVLTGVCGLYKIPSMAIAGAWIVSYLLMLPRRHALRRIALLICGIAIPWLLAVLWFAAHGALGDFVTGVFVYHRYNAAFIAPPWLDVVEDFTDALVTRAPLLLATTAVGLYVMVERRAPELRWVAPWIGFTMAAVALQRQLADYHYLLAVPPLALAGGYGLVAVAGALQGAGARARAFAAAVVVVLGALVARESVAWIRAYGPDAMALTGRLSRDAYLRRIQPGSFSMATEEEAARYVRDRTSPSEGILVWGLSPGIYALADRHPVTRYPFHKILMTDAPLSRMWPGLSERRAGFMEGIRRDPPAYVLVGRGDTNGFEPEDSTSSMAHFTALRQMIERDYHSETTIGRFTILRRNTGAPQRTSPDPLAAIHLDEPAVDWARPLPSTPPGGLAEPGYVGAEACDPCHSTIATSFARHSMASTGVRPIAALDQKWLASIFDAGSSTYVRHGRSGMSYRPFRQAGSYFVEQSLRASDGSLVMSSTQRLTHALSAGSYGMAFYFRQGNRFWQIPIDYYAKLGRWDVDAGAADDFRFSKPLEMSCISCHGDFPRRLAGSDQVFFEPMPAGVGCERCHGPGARHVKTGRAEDIVNPPRLSSARQIDACAQCHESDHLGLRAGRDDFAYRPGEALADTQVNWVAEPPEADRFLLLAHPERMMASACYRGSGGQLTCTTCHDPHVSSREEPASWWDGKCKGCHATRPCTEEQTVRMARGDHCVECHMQRGPTSNVPLVAVTDHWIQRRPLPLRAGATPERPAQLVSWPSLLKEPSQGDDLAALEAMAWSEAGARDEGLRRGVAVSERRPNVPRLWEWLARRLNERGDVENATRAEAEALHFDPDARWALLGLGQPRPGPGTREETTEGMRALDRALGLDPEDGDALQAKGMALFRNGRIDEARPLFERAASVAPWTAASHVALAAIALRAGDRDAAIGHLEAARSTEPTDRWVLDRLAEQYAAAGDAPHASEVRGAVDALHAMGRAPSTSEATAWLPESWR